VSERELSSENRTEDEWLAVRCQLGERAAFDLLVSRWESPLWFYVRRLVPDDEEAGDLTQDIWLRILRGIAALRDPAVLRSWMFGIAHRVVTDRLRRKYAWPAETDLDLDTLETRAPEENPFAEELGMLDGAIDSLPVVEREVLTLFYLNELSLAEVASSLSVPVGTIKSRLFRARRMLRRTLEPDR
jgi:RNA polymerase sigma factor (sigma-70 family)